MILLRVCHACQKKNRVPAKYLASSGKCGHCQQVLPPVSAPIDVDASLFNELISHATVPVLVDFWASWCGPCKAAAPEIQQLAAQQAGHVLVLKVNTEQESALASQYAVRSIPYFALFKQGKIVWQQAGLLRASQLASIVAQHS